MVVLKEFPSRDELVNHLSGKVAALLGDACVKRTQASLALSGGKTPLEFFRALSAAEIPWESVLVTLVDERWVDPDSVDSNERLVRENLLKGRAKAARFIGLKGPFRTAKEAEALCHAELSERLSLPFDVVCLGMGQDGHTASLFPGANTLRQAVDLGYPRLCIAVSPPNASYERMTLTLKAILSSRHIIVHIQGEEKRRVLEEALGEGDPLEMPIRFVLRQDRVPVEVYWAP